jgi:hypothetical protein
MADPISGAIAAIVTASASVLTAGFTQSVATTLTSFAVQAAGTAVLSTAINAVVQPSVGAGGSPTQWQSDTDSGVPFVMGRRAIAGHAVHIDEWGPDNRYLSVVNVYSGAGPIKAFGDFYADETVVSFGGAYNKVSTGSYKDVMWMDRRMGAQPDTALASPTDPAIAGALPGWTSSYKLSGKASSMWTLALDKERKRYPAGAPKPLQVIEGIYGYDPRLDSTYPGGSGSCRLNDRSTYVWIENPIIGALNFAIGLRENGKVVAGISDEDTPSLNGIDTDAFITCANVADANGWTISAHWTSKDDKHQVYLAMLQAGGAKDCTVAGKLSCYTRGAPKTSVVTISAADTAGPVEISTAAPRIGRVNTIIPRCVLETHKWEMTPCDEVSVAAHITTDRAKRSRGMDYPFVPDAVQASQLAGLDIEDSREPITGRMPLKRYMQQLKPGDAFTITEPGFSLDGLKAVVVDREIDTASGIVTITFRSDTDAKYDFALGLDPTPPTYPELTPPDPNDVPAASSDDWDVTGTSVTTGSGQTLVGHPALSVTGDFVNEDVASAVIEYRKAADSAWIYHGEFASVADFETLIQPLSPDTIYDVSIRLRNIFGVLGDETDRLVIEDVQTPPFFTSDDSVNLGGVPAGTVHQRVERLIAGLGAVAAGVRVEQVERATEDGVLLASITTLSGEIDDVEGSIVDILALEIDPESVLALAFTEIDGRLDDAEGTITDIIALEIDPGSVLIQRFETVEGRVDDTEGSISDIISLDLDPGSALLTRFSDIEASVEDVEGAITEEASVRLTGDQANLALIERLTAGLGATSGALTVERTVRASEDALIIADVTTLEGRVDDAEGTITDILSLSIDPESVLASSIIDLDGRLDDAEAGIVDILALDISPSSALALRFTDLEAELDPEEGGSYAAGVQSSLSALATADEVAAAIRERLIAETAAARATMTAERQIRITAEGLLASDISTLEGELDVEDPDSVAGTLSGAINDIRTLDLDALDGSALAALVIEVEAEFDPEGEGLAATVSAINLTFVTQSDIDETMALFGLDVGSAYSVTTALSDLGDDIDGVAGDLDTLELSVADIAAEYVTEADITGALAAYDIDIQTQFSDVDDALDGIDTSISGINASLTSLATADLASAASRENLLALLGSARAETNVERIVRAGETSALSGQITDLEAEFDDEEAGSFAAYVNETFVTFAGFSDELEGAYSALDLTLNATWNDLADGVEDLAETIDGVPTVTPGLSSLVSVLAEALIDASDPDNPVALAFFEIALAATGSEPALLRLTTGGGDPAVLAAERLVVGTFDGAGDLADYVDVMEFESGFARMLTEMRLAVSAALTAYADEGGGGEVEIFRLINDPTHGAEMFLRDRDGNIRAEFSHDRTFVDGAIVRPPTATKLLSADAEANYGVGSAGPETTIASVRLDGVTIPNVLTLHGSRLKSRAGANAADNTSVVVTWRLRAGTGPNTHVQTLASGLISYNQPGGTVLEQSNDFYDEAVVNRIYTLDETLTGEVWINLTVQVTAAANNGDKAYFEGNAVAEASRTALTVSVLPGGCDAATAI